MAPTPQTRTSGGRRNLTLVGAVVSAAVVAYDLDTVGADSQTWVRTLGAVGLLWALVFVLAEASPELGSAVAVFLLLVFLVARRGAVSALLAAFGQKSSKH